MQQQIHVQITSYENCEKKIMLEIANNAYEFYMEFNAENNCYIQDELEQFTEFHDQQQIIQHDDSYGCRLFVLTINDSLAGVIRVNIQFAYISHLYVVPNYRRKGIGKMLLDYVEKILTERGFKKVDIIVYDAGYQLLKHAGYIITKSAFSVGSGIQHTAYKNLVECIELC